MKNPMTLRQLWRPVLFFLLFCLIGGVVGMWINHRIEELERKPHVTNELDRA